MFDSKEDEFQFTHMCGYQVMFRKAELSLSLSFAHTQKQCQSLSRNRVLIDIRLMCTLRWTHTKAMLRSCLTQESANCIK